MGTKVFRGSLFTIVQTGKKKKTKSINSRMDQVSMAHSYKEYYTAVNEQNTALHNMSASHKHHGK